MEGKTVPPSGARGKRCSHDPPGTGLNRKCRRGDGGRADCGLRIPKSITCPQPCPLWRPAMHICLSFHQGAWKLQMSPGRRGCRLSRWGDSTDHAQYSGLRSRQEEMRLTPMIGPPTCCLSAHGPGVCAPPLHLTSWEAELSLTLHSDAFQSRVFRQKCEMEQRLSPVVGAEKPGRLRPKLLPTPRLLGAFWEAVPGTCGEGAGLPSLAVPSTVDGMVFSVTAVREQDGCSYSPQHPLWS